MINEQNVKYQNIIPPAAIIDNTSATVLSYIDTSGFNHLTMIFQLGATDIATVAMKVQHCATSGGSYADISGAAASGTTGDGRLPTATDDNGLFMMSIPLTGVNRYVKPVYTGGDGAAGTYLSCLAILSKAEQPPYDATTRGLAGQIIL